ncbi:glycoside hydrolase family 6 protein [Streptomyces tricolor]|uniref:glycoside hydrolase family 6 protein n=1 Tax=Streptomyces tricolor TaxID=68277 RepID=UPI003D74728C
MTHAARREPARWPRPGRRRCRAASTVAALATLALGLAGQLTAQPAAAAPAHVDNLFAGASFYVNPDCTDLVGTSVARTPDATLRAKMQTVGGHPTAVWLDRIAAIGGGDANAGRKSLADHLDPALAQKKRGQPITATFVVYDLPGRDCAALASNGELPLTQAGLDRYKSEYIDAVAHVFQNDDASATDNAWCDDAAVGCAGARLKVVPLSTPVAGADACREAGFTSGALAAGRSTGALRLRPAKADWSDFDETDDHSHGTATPYTDAPAIPAYLGTTPAWGAPPA